MSREVRKMYEKVTEKPESYIRDALKANLEPIGEWSTDLQFQSHIGSSPYFKKGETWPTNSHGIPLDFIIQVTRKDASLLPERIELFQFYILWSGDTPYEFGDESWLFKAYPHIDREKSILIDKPEQIREKEGWPSPWPKPSKPSFESVQSFPSSLDIESSRFLGIFAESVGEDDAFDEYEKLEEALLGEEALYNRTQIGGYPQWI